MFDLAEALSKASVSFVAKERPSLTVPPQRGCRAGDPGVGLLLGNRMELSK